MKNWYTRKRRVLFENFQNISCTRFFKNIIREGRAHSTKLIMYFRTANHDHSKRFASYGAVHLRFTSIPPGLTPGISIFWGGKWKIVAGKCPGVGKKKEDKLPAHGMAGKQHSSSFHSAFQCPNYHFRTSASPSFNCLY